MLNHRGFYQLLLSCLNYIAFTSNTSFDLNLKYFKFLGSKLVITGITVVLTCLRIHERHPDSIPEWIVLLQLSVLLASCEPCDHHVERRNNIAGLMGSKSLLQQSKSVGLTLGPATVEDWQI